MSDELESKLERARRRVQKARAEAARLRRAVDSQNRRAIGLTRAVLGAALLDIADTRRADQLVQSVTRWMDRHVTDPTARAALEGTPFALTPSRTSGGDGDGA